MAEPIPGPRWDFWVRHFLFAGLLGTILGQWLFTTAELIHPLRLGHLHSLLVCCLYTPLVVVPVTLWLAWRRWRRVPSFRVRAPWSDLRWTALGLGTFGVWSGAYWAVGGFAGGRTMTLLSTALEDRIPFLPAATVIYLTVYWFAILPIFVLPDRLSRARVAAAYAATLAPCLLAFAVFPVTLDRPAVDPNDGIFAWALSLVHRADPPHNCLPSSHCAMAMMGGLLLSEVDRRLGALGVLYACIIGVTTVLIKQHYVVDVLAGFAVAATAWWALIRRGTAAAWSRAPSGRAG